MVDRIGSGGALAREALLAAMKSQSERAQGVRDAADAIAQQALGAKGTEKAEGPDEFASQLTSEITGVNRQVEGVDRLPQDLLTGKVQDFHEVTMQIKQAEFSFRFAMEIRNKLLDAYREVMRMNV